MITYRLGNDLDLDQVLALYHSSTLGERRPIEERTRVEGMIKTANLVVTAWDGHRLVGMARSLSDYCYVTYVADLAVCQEYQRQGIGRELLRRTQQAAGEQAMLVLLAAPAANDFYRHIGFEHHPRAWRLPPGGALK